MFDRLEEFVLRGRRRLIRRILMRECDVPRELATEIADNYDEGISVETWAGRINGTTQITPEQWDRLIELLQLVLTFLVAIL